jgi:cytochrome P450/NADPH-cytochrome P450 reductase
MARPPEQDQADDDWVDDGTRRPIPQPAETFLLGNIPDIDPVKSIISLRRLAKVYGGIFQLKLRNMIVLVSTQKIVHAISDESKFEKVLSAPLFQVRNFTGDGLFTAFSGEHNWTLAHHILIPAFGPIAIKKMQGMMMEIMSQMLMYWETHAGQPFEAADQFTRLTFVGVARARWLWSTLLTDDCRIRSAGAPSGIASTRSSRKNCTPSLTSWSISSSSRASARGGWT